MNKSDIEAIMKQLAIERGIFHSDVSGESFVGTINITNIIRIKVND